MLHGVEADGAKMQRVFDSTGYFRDGEGLHQPQHLHVLPAAVFLQPCLQETAQRGEALRQLPAGQRCGLIQRACLLLDQRQVMQRIEDHRLAFVTALVPAITSLP